MNHLLFAVIKRYLGAKLRIQSYLKSRKAKINHIIEANLKNKSMKHADKATIRGNILEEGQVDENKIMIKVS